MSDFRASPMLIHHLESLRDEFRHASQSIFDRLKRGFTLVCEHAEAVPTRVERRAKFDGNLITVARRLDGTVYEPPLDQESNSSSEDEECEPPVQYSVVILTHGLPEEFSEYLSRKRELLYSMGTSTYAPWGSGGLTEGEFDQNGRMLPEAESTETERRWFSNLECREEHKRFENLCNRAGKFLVSLTGQFPFPENVRALTGDWEYSAGPHSMAWMNALVDIAQMRIDGLIHLSATRFSIPLEPKSGPFTLNAPKSPYYYLGLPDAYLASWELLQWMLTLAADNTATRSTPNASLYSISRTKKDWVLVLKKLGLDISDYEFREALKAGTYVTLPGTKLTAKKVRLLLSKLPEGYVDK